MTVILFLLLAATPDRQIQDLAESAYQMGLEHHHDLQKARTFFLQAAEHYGQLIRQGASNPTIQLNLGNSYFLGGDIPRAIIAYHQGLRMDPGNSQLEQALEGVREAVLYPVGSPFGRPEPESLPTWVRHFHPGFWFAFGFGFYSLGWVTLTRWLMLGQGRYLFLTLILGAIVAILAIGIWKHWQRIVWEESHPLVVITQDGVILRKGNNHHFPPRFETPLNRGVEAHLKQVRGQWYQIQLSGGETGWIPRHLALIETEVP